MCWQSESLRRRNAQTAEDSDTRIARLEDKMESLLTAMQPLIGSRRASGSSDIVPLKPLQPLNGDSISSSTSLLNGSLVNNKSGDLSYEGPTFAADSNATVSLNPNPLFLSPHYPLSPSVAPPNHADERLVFFQSRMLPYFSFINLAPGTTSWYLCKNRPFLFQAIDTVTTFSTQKRLTKVKELKRILFTSALLEAQSNIDLLLGLLIYLAWSTDAFLSRADLVSCLIMLAILLVYDLRFFKPSLTDVQLMMTIIQGQANKTGYSTNDETSHGLLERQWAVLACFF